MKKVSIGGQAVIEGVMMKNAETYAVAVRKPDKDIEVNIDSYEAIGNKIKILKLPILRGVVNFIESMVIGIKTLTYSSSFYEEETPVEDDKAQEMVQEEDVVAEASKRATKKNKKDKRDSKASENAEIFFTILLSIVIVIGIFMLLPAFVTGLLSDVIKNRYIIVILEGVLRLAIFIGYVAAISQMKDIKRVFMYHGAEHKTINCLEAGDRLTVENVKKHSRYHKRCGTSFLFIVMFISIIVFMFINVDNTFLRMLYRVLLVPVIAGISYEFIKFAGKHDNKCIYILSVPGMWVQRLTTREPEDAMMEVAIKSVEAVLDWETYVDELNKGQLEEG